MVTKLSLNYPDLLMSDAYGAEIKWADFNNDGLLDMVSRNQFYSPQAKIFLNNGDDSFSEYANLYLSGESEGALAIGDYDNDCDDFFLAGGVSFISE